MKTGYSVILALFIFSLMSNVVDEMGVFPNHGLVEVGIGSADIQEIDTATIGLMNTSETVADEESELSIFGGIELLLNCGWVVLKSIGYTVLVYPLLTNYGVPAVLALAIQSIVTYIEAPYFIEFISNRRLTQ